VRTQQTHESKEQTMGTRSLSPAAPTTSARQEGATLTSAQHEDEIEVLRVFMSHYAEWGDTQQWDKFGSLFHDDAVIIIDAGPRPDPEADPRIEVHGREAFIAAQSASLDGVHTAHNMFLPEITIVDDTHAHATWGLHDYIKTPVVNFNGYGHISQDYVKVDGQWKITRLHTTRMIVDEEWLADTASTA
jgi:SnoaL-like domain